MSSHARRDSSSSHSPITFLSSRVVPSMPRSLVRFASRAASLSTGSGSSTPSSDHVPLERIAACSSTGTAANADAVSWLATA